MVTQLQKNGRQKTVCGLGLIGMLHRKMVLFRITILSSQGGNGILINFQGCCEEKVKKKYLSSPFL
jgi:hypothetical protein